MKKKKKKKKQNHLNVVSFFVEEDLEFAYGGELILRTTFLYNHTDIYIISKCLMNLMGNQWTKSIFVKNYIMFSIKRLNK